MQTETVVIANCGGFWGDDPTAARRQLAGGHVDYLVMDYLAEVTMAILQKQRQRDPKTGFATDFLVQLEDVLADCVTRGVVVVSNAGGVNPVACGEAIEALAGKLGIADEVRVGVVFGDDLFDRLDGLLASGEELAHAQSGLPLGDVRDSVLSANAYIGCAGIVQALELGANVIVGGRLTDTALALGPLVHEFGWSEDDWDRRASGIVAGHIIECGPQCTGGNFTDWRSVDRTAPIGYPIIEASPDGSFVVTKHPGTGGLVTVETVSEQLLYELGAPEYLSPDGVAHFDSIKLEQQGRDRVSVSGVRGGPAPSTLKVSVSYAHGYRIFGRIIVTGPDTLAKAEEAADIFWAAAGGRDFYEQTSTQFVGWNATHPPLATCEPGEVLVQVAARDQSRSKLEESFAPFVVGTGLGSVPGFGLPADQGRPRVSEVVGYWPAFIGNAHVEVEVLVDGRRETLAARPTLVATRQPPVAAATDSRLPPSGGAMVDVALVELCLARSGDKGDTCNVGVIARSDAIFAWMLEHLNTDLVKEHFAGVCRGAVERHVLPNLRAVNFLLEESLGGGGTSSIQLDAQGKTYAQFLLAARVTVDKRLLSSAS
jgi:hypothetical protein